MDKDPRVDFKKWVDKYEKQTGEKAILPPDYVLQFLPERGFSSYKVDNEGKMLVIYQTCGDIRFWRDVAELIAQTNNLDYLCTSCLLDINTYMRLFGAEIIHIEQREGQKRYTCKDSLGRKVVATYRGINKDTGKPCYWVTQYLKELLD